MKNLTMMLMILLPLTIFATNALAEHPLVL